MTPWLIINSNELRFVMFYKLIQIIIQQKQSSNVTLVLKYINRINYF
jgi:hypothetical protein